MIYIMFSLPETITIWVKTGNDGFGGFSWSIPVKRDSRNANKQEQFRDANGQLTMSSRVVYSKATELAVGVMVLVGESSASSPTVDAEEVRAIASIPSAITMKKVWL